MADAVTLKDVAAAAGVHVSTASRALNPETRSVVNVDTAGRVLVVAERLGYRPNPLARGLRTNRTLTIGMVVPDLMNPLFPPIYALTHRHPIIKNGSGNVSYSHRLPESHLALPIFLNFLNL